MIGVEVVTMIPGGVNEIGIETTVMIDQDATQQDELMIAKTRARTEDREMGRKEENKIDPGRRRALEGSNSRISVVMIQKTMIGVVAHLEVTETAPNHRGAEIATVTGNVIVTLELLHPPRSPSPNLLVGILLNPLLEHPQHQLVVVKR